MNAYVKQMVEHRLDYLGMEEKEIESHIAGLKEQLSKQEEKLKKIREEKKALQG